MHMRETGKTRIQLKAMAMAAAAVITAVLMFGLMTIVSHAEEVTVTASSVKIRASADVNSGMIGGAMAGEKLQVTGEVTGADNYTWYQVTGEFENGATTGYVRSDCVSKTGSAGTTTPAVPTTTNPTTPATTPATDVSAVQPVTAKVTGEQVRVRSNASTSGSIVSTVRRDVVLTVTGTAQDSENKTWYQVSFTDASGQMTGFIREDFVSLEGELTPPVTDPVEPEVPTDPVDPVEPEPTPTPVQKDYDTQYYEPGEDEVGGWYLLDYSSGQRYLITQLFETNQKNKTLYEEGQAQLKTMRIIMIILVVAVILLALTATLLFFKIRDMMDAAYFEEVEKETIRTRQGQRSGGKASMPTVGASGNRSSAARPGGQSQQRPAGSSQQRVSGSQSQQKPAGSSQQRTSSGQSQQKPGSAGQKPRPAGNGQPRPAGSGQQRPQNRGTQQERPVSREQQNASRPAKNFVADDDEFDFEYLNWDGEEDN